MFSRTHTLSILAVLALLVVLSGSTVAQTNQTGPTVTVETSASTTDENQTVEPIDQRTGLVDSSVEDGSMVLIIESDVPQKVTLTDTGTAMNGRRTPIQQVQLQEGTNRVTVPAEPFEGHYIVTVSTGEYVYPVVKDHSGSIIGGPWTVDDVRLSALAAGVSVLLVSILVTVRTITGRTQEPERVA